MSDKKTQANFADTLGGGVPIRTSSWALPAFKESSHAKLYEAMEENLKYTQGKPKAPKIYEIFDVMSGLMQETGLGLITAEQAAKRGQEALEKICEGKCTL